MLTTRFKLWMSVLVVMSLLIAVASAVAQPKDQDYLTYRQKLMASIGANWSAIGVSMKAGLPSKANIAVHAKAIADASKLIEGAFKKEITEGKTDAKAEVWQDRDKFVAAAKKLGEESGKLAAAAGGDDAALMAQQKATGKSCGGCHKPFRKPKKERFKR